MSYDAPLISDFPIVALLFVEANLRSMATSDVLSKITVEPQEIMTSRDKSGDPAIENIQHIPHGSRVLCLRS